MVENLFKNSDPACDVPEVPKVDFDFVEDCDITSLPGPIYGCPLPEILPEPEIPCPVFNSITTSIDVGVSGDQGGIRCVPSDTPAITMRVTRSDKDPCTYDIDLDINVPLPPPPCETSIQGGDLTVNVAYDDCIASGGSLTVSKETIPKFSCDTPDICEFIIGGAIDIAIPRPPCPVLTVDNFGVTTKFVNLDGGDDCGPCVSVFRCDGPRIIPGDCDTPEQCEFGFDLDICVPIPKQPCPKITVRTFRVGSKFNDDPVNCPIDSVFRIVEDPVPGNCGTPDRCNFLVDLEILVPIPRQPCPVINTNLEVDVGWSDCITGDSVFRIIQNLTEGDCDNPPRCEFLFDLVLKIPIPKPPCTLLTTSTPDDFVRVYYDDPGCPPRMPTFLITSFTETSEDCNIPDRCGYDISLDIPVVIPRQPCTTITRRTFSVTTVFDTPECLTDCENRFEIIPVIQTGDCNTPDRCEFLVDLELCIPVPKPLCPEFEISFPPPTSRYSDCAQEPSIFTIIPRPTPGDCDTPDQCAFDVTLDINVPIPRPRCPIIKPRTFKVVTGYDDEDCVQPPPVFVCDGPRIPPTGNNCDRADQCIYDIDLEIYVPIPRPPCVNIINKTIDDFVDVTFDDCNTPTPASTACPQPIFRIEKMISAQPPGCKVTQDCEWEIELCVPVRIPRIPCPTITTNNPKINIGYPECLPSECRNIFTCTPLITPGDCKTPDKCEFVFDLELCLPIPKPPCPKITTGSFGVNVRYAREGCEPTGSVFRITDTSSPGGCDENGNSLPDICQSVIDLEIEVSIPEPPCVTINNISDENFVTVGYAGSSCVKNKRSRFSIDKRDTTIPTDCGTVQTCEYDVDLEIVVTLPPPPCVNITNKTDENFVKVGYADCPLVKNKKSKFKITPTGRGAGPKGKKTPAGCDTVEECSYEFDVEIYVPIPRPPCVNLVKKNGKPPVIVGWSDCTTIKDPETGETKPSTWTITKKEKPVSTNCTTTTECEWEIDLQVVVPLPRPKCPEIKFTPNCGLFFHYADSSIPFECSNSVFSISQRETNPNQCSLEAENICQTDIDVQLDVCLPRPPCVNITTGNTRLNVTIAPQDEPPCPQKMVLSATPRHNLKVGTNQPPECNIEIDLEVDICLPPVSVCPKMDMGEVVVRKIKPAIIQHRDPKFKMTPRVECIPGVNTQIYFDFDLEVPFCDYKFKFDNTGQHSGGPPQNSAITKKYYNPEKAQPPRLDQDALTDKLRLFIQKNKQNECELNFSAEARINIPAVYYDFPAAKIQQKCAISSCCTGPTGATGPTGIQSGCNLRSSGCFSPVKRAWFEEPSGPTGGTSNKQSNSDTPIKVTKQLQIEPNVLRAGEVKIFPSGLGCGRLMIDDDELKLEINLDTAACPSDSGIVTGGSGGGGPGPTGSTGPTGPCGCPGPTGATGADGIAGATGLMGPTGPAIEISSSFNAQGFPQLVFGDFYYDLPDGPTGATGATGLGATGATGVGIVGPSGLAGVEGQTGPTGPLGATGPTGDIGETGPTGPTGLGETGPTGATGATGPTGPAGISGATGLRGATGFNGATGPRGNVGPRGARGAIGPAGPIGVSGLIGATGLRGITGPEGPRGPTGAQGPTGRIGPSGLRGLRGFSGPIGATGRLGPTGPDGETGPTGPTGPSGRIGLTGPSGLKGPTGATGPAGEQGCAGATGATGLDGPTGPAGGRGERGSTGPQGPAGVPGQSGSRGPIGVSGLTGPTGATGPAGITGPTGASGPQGPVGPSGQIGGVGAVGPRGERGFRGEKGDQGATGPIGPFGLSGPTGIAGPTGVSGPVGGTGPTGPYGPCGPPGEPGPQGASGAIGSTGATGPAFLTNTLLAQIINAVQTNFELREAIRSVLTS